MLHKPTGWLGGFIVLSLVLSGCGGTSGGAVDDSSDSLTADSDSLHDSTSDSLSDSGSGSASETVTEDTATEGTGSEDTEGTGSEDTQTSDSATEDTATEDTQTGDSATEDTATEDTEPEPMLRLDDVQPPAASRELEVLLTLTGELFGQGMTVEIYLGSDDAIELGEAEVSTDEQSATVVLPADSSRPQGLYAVTVRNPNSDEATLTGALLVSALHPPVVTGVEPALAWQGDPADAVLSDRSVRLLGSGFVSTPWVTLVDVDDPNNAFDAAEVHFIDTETLVAVVPSESQAMPAGQYYVWVTNPDNLSAQWIDEVSEEAGIFVVTEIPPPRITQIGPVQWPFMDAVNPFVVQGEHFQDSATIELLGELGDVALEPVTFVSATELSTTIPGSAVTVGIYPVRVTNPDGQSDVFYAYEAKNGTDGHFAQEFSALAVSLLSPRERLAAAVGFDAYGSAHVYVVGGIDEDGTVRADGESAAVSTHGELGEFSALQQWGGLENPRTSNQLAGPRQGHSLLRVGQWLYAIGGSMTNTKGAPGEAFEALSTVERAEILGLQSQPTAQAPVRVGSGELPIGTWYYRISSLGEQGESLASAAVQILNQNGTLEVCWTPVAGATSYNIYRSPAADGRPGSTRLLAPQVAGPCFLDDGAAQPAPGYASATPVLGGTLTAGQWTYRLSSVKGGIESVAGYATSVLVEEGTGAVQLTWSEVPGATYNLYRSADAGAAGEPTYLLASGLEGTQWIDLGDGSPNLEIPADDGIAVLPVGSVSRWEELSGITNRPREGLGAVAVSAAQNADISVVSYLFLAGGRPDASGDAYESTVEVAAVYDDGDLGPWTSLTSASMTTARAFFPLVTTEGRGLTAISVDAAAEDPSSMLPPVPAPDDEPVFLVAFQGDSGFAGVANDGLVTSEVALVDRSLGTLSAWAYQTDGDLVNGRRTHGHQALLIDDFAYCLPGVDTETTDGEPVPLGSNASRFPVDISADTDAEVLGSFMAANAELVTKRSYYAMVRVSGRVFVLGGNDGQGAIGSVESIPQ